MKIKPITTGAYEEICYLIWNEEKQAVVIDPGYDEDLILQAIDKEGLRIVAYLCTHGHADHINALAALHQQRPAPIAMHSDDWSWAFGSLNTIPPYYPVPTKPTIDSIHKLEEATHWKFEDIGFKRIETPGHTPGSCCLLFEHSNIMVSGDTLFKGSCGRTDFPGGDAQQLTASLQKLKSLPKDTIVYPGHGPHTTIGYECDTNYFMRDA